MSKDQNKTTLFSLLSGTVPGLTAPAEPLPDSSRGEAPDLFKMLREEGGSLEVLLKFVEKGGKFDRTSRDGFENNHVMAIAQCVDFETFAAVAAALPFDGFARSNRGESEIDIIERHFGQDGLKIFLGPEAELDLFKLLEAGGYDGLRGFIEVGGVFDQAAQDSFSNDNQVMAIAKYAGAEGLALFEESGGEFNYLAKDEDGLTEASVIARRAGKEGLQVFLEAGGLINPYEITVKHRNPDHYPKTEQDCVFLALGPEGYSIYAEAMEGERVIRRESEPADLTP